MSSISRLSNASVVCFEWLIDGSGDDGDDEKRQQSVRY